MRSAMSMVVGLVLGWLASAQAADRVRTWSDTQGRTMRAEFVREVDGDVTFIKDGKLITLPLDRFSKADQQVIRELQSAASAAADSTESDPFASAPAPGKRAPAPAGEPTASTSSRPQASKKDIVISNRAWTDHQGNQTTARFVRVFRENVVLLRGGRTLPLPYHSLSSVDQEYVKEVLTARGEESLIPPSPTSLSDNALSSPDGEPSAAPTQPANENADPVVAAPPSATFDELRQQQEKQRQELAAQLADEAASAAPAAAVSENSPAADRESQTAKSARRFLDGQMLAELRPVWIIGGVVGGVLGTVAVIVAVAITIASTNTTRKARRYS